MYVLHGSFRVSRTSYVAGGWMEQTGRLAVRDQRCPWHKTMLRWWYCAAGATATPASGRATCYTRMI